MKKILEVLNSIIVSKLEYDGISIEARNILVDAKKEITKMIEDKLTQADMPEIELRLSKISKEIDKISE